MINVALFGAGRIGSIHGDNVMRNPNAHLVALYDPFAQNADSLSTMLGCEQMSPDEIFASDHIDAVLVCSATDTHADLIERAAASGKHVFCEKPIDLSLTRVKQCIERVSQSDVKVMVAFNRRFDPNFQNLQQQVSTGGIGEVELVSIISKDPGPPPLDYIKVSGGLFRDMTIHDFDMARFLLGEEVVTVNAQASCLVDPKIAEAGDVDSAVVSMRTASGKLVQISNSRRAAYGYDQRIEVHGSDGMLIGQNVNENTVVKYDREGVTGAKPLFFFLERYENAYRAELDAFIHLLSGEAVALPTLYDGLQALLLAESALLSLQQGRTVEVAELA